MTIEGNRIVIADHLRFEVDEDQEILSYEVIILNKEVNDSKFNQPCPFQLAIDFDFIDPENGVTIDIIHTGSRGELRLAGTVRGILEDIKMISNQSSRIPKLFAILGEKKSYKTILTIMAFIGFCIATFGTYSIYAGPDSIVNRALTSDKMDLPWLIIILGATYMLMPLYLIWSGRRRFPSTLAVPTTV